MKSISVSRLKRLQQLNVLLLHGGYTDAELAARFGVTERMIKHDRSLLRKQWQREISAEQAVEKRRRRLLELAQIKRYAMESYHRSRQDKQQIRTEYGKEKCSECNGTGKLEKCKCLNCDGTGKVEVERITKQVEGRPGDPKFLQVAITCVKEMMRLEGIDEPQTLRIVAGAGHNFRTAVDNIDPEKVLEARFRVLEHKQIDERKQA